MWDAPESFYLWVQATERGDFSVILKAPLTKVNWLAANLLFSVPSFRNRHCELQTAMLRALLQKG